MGFLFSLSRFSLSLSICIYLSINIEECVCVGGAKRGFMRFRSRKECTLVRWRSSACDMHHCVK